MSDEPTTTGRFILVTFKPKRREEYYATKEALEDRVNIIAEYGVNYQAFTEETTIVRKRLKPTTGVERLRP